MSKVLTCHRRDVSCQKSAIFNAFQWRAISHRHCETWRLSVYNHERAAVEEPDQEEVYSFGERSRRLPGVTRKAAVIDETDELRRRSRIIRKTIERRSFPQWLSRYAPGGANEISKFCQRNNITKELKAAVELADRCFWGSAIKLEKSADPETGSVQIALSLTIRGKSPDEVLDAYYAFGEKLIGVVPSEKRRFLVVSYDME